MRKYLVLVIVVLLAAVLFIRYLEREEAALAPPSSAQQMEEGVPLPPDAQTLSLPEFSPEAYRPVSRLDGTAQEPAPEIIPFAMPADACLRDTKVKDVIAGYDEWIIPHQDEIKSEADRVRSYAVLQSVGEQGVKSLAARVANYQACLSLAADKDLCVGLPKGRTKKSMDLRRSCGWALHGVGLAGYSLGRSGYSFCSAYYKNQLHDISLHLRESEFCDIAKGGLAAISDKFCGSAPAGTVRQRCLGSFPKGLSGCNDDEDDDDCERIWRVNEAVKSNSLENLSYDLRPLVLAMIDKKEEHCRPLADSIVQGYCPMKSSIDQQMMQIEMGRKQVEMDKGLRSLREQESAD